MKCTYLIIGNSYISINLSDQFKFSKQDYIKINDPFDLRKFKPNKKKKYIIIYLYIRRSKNILFNISKLKFTLNFFLKFNHKIIYISTSEFFPKKKNINIHIKNEKILNGKKADILRICQIYGGKLINKKYEYGVNGFLESLKENNLITLKKDFKNIRSYCNFNELFNTLLTLGTKKSGKKYILLNKKKISFIELAKEIIKISNKKNSSILIEQNENKNLNYKKNIIYGKIKKIISNSDFNTNLKKAVKNQFRLL